MREEQGDIFTREADAICVTTNGFVKSNGECVMGCGSALQAALRKPSVPRILGSRIKYSGNRVHDLGLLDGRMLYAFPVKPASIKVDQFGDNLVSHMRDRFREGQKAPGWAAKADLEIIRQSAIQLKEIADQQNYRKVVLPRPGCGAGELRWSDVRPILEQILDDRFIVMNLP